MSRITFDMNAFGNNGSGKVLAERLPADAVLSNFQRIADRMLKLLDLLDKKDSSTAEYSFLLDGLKFQIMSYAQSFCDAISIIYVNDKMSTSCTVTSLSSAISYFFAISGNITSDCECWAKFLIEGDRTVRDYYNHECLNEDIMQAVLNYKPGIQELVIVTGRLLNSLGIDVRV